MLTVPSSMPLRRELLEKSLTFEQTASLLRAPANLDDQSIAYQYIMYGKGAFVFKLLRDTLGAAEIRPAAPHFPARISRQKCLDRRF